MIETPRYEDFEIEYWAENRWAMLGMGFTMAERKKEGADLSPYLQLENIDPKWYVMRSRTWCWSGVLLTSWEKKNRLKEVIMGDKSAGSEVKKDDDKKGTNGDSAKEVSNAQPAKI